MQEEYLCTAFDRSDPNESKFSEHDEWIVRLYLDSNTDRKYIEFYWMRMASVIQISPDDGEIQTIDTKDSYSEEEIKDKKIWTAYIIPVQANHIRRIDMNPY